MGFSCVTQASTKAVPLLSLLDVEIWGITHVKKKKWFPVKKKKSNWKPQIHVKGLVCIRHLINIAPPPPPASFSKNGSYHFQWLLLYALLKVKQQQKKNPLNTCHLHLIKRMVGPVILCVEITTPVLIS